MAFFRIVKGAGWHNLCDYLLALDPGLLNIIPYILSLLALIIAMVKNCAPVLYKLAALSGIMI